MTADFAVAFGYVRPFDVLVQMQKYTPGTLIGAVGHHDLVTFAEHKTNRVIVDHICVRPAGSSGISRLPTWRPSPNIRIRPPNRTTTVAIDKIGTNRKNALRLPK